MKMVRPRTTGGSHNKQSSTYRSKRTSNDSKSQRSIFDMLNTKKSKIDKEQRTSDDENGVSVEEQSTSTEQLNILANQNVTMSDNNDSEESNYETPTSSDDESDDAMLNNEGESFHNSCPYLAAQQAQARWEEQYDFALYSVTGQGWLCKICSEYGNVGDDY